MRGVPLPASQIGIYKALLDNASGLDYLHSLGVVHGDLKSANVLLKGSARDSRGFSCKISDFWLGRVLGLDDTDISTRKYGERRPEADLIIIAVVSFKEHAVPACIIVVLQ
jgi:serine/threonine protein kinase